MGKLVEALKKREKALTDYQEEIQKAGGSPKPAEKPKESYDHILRLNELHYLREQAGNFLVAAFVGMTPEQRMEFFRKTLKQKNLDYFTEVGFMKTVRDLYYKDDGRTAYRAFLADEKNFGRPLDVVVAGMRFRFKKDRREALDRELAESIPNATLAQQAEFYYTKMSDEEIGEFFRLVVEDEELRSHNLGLTLEDMVHSDAIGSFLLNNRNYRENMTWLDAVEEMEQVMGPQLVEETAQKIEALPQPRLNPHKNISPYAERINQLQQGLPPRDPRLQLLERVKGILVYPAHDYLRYLNNRDGSKTGTVGLTSAMDAYAFQGVTRFLEKNLTAPLREKLPHSKAKSGDMGDGKSNIAHYDPEEVLPVHIRFSGPEGVKLEEPELNTLRQKAEGAYLTPEVKQAIHDFMACIDQMGEKSYWTDQVVQLLEGTWEDPKKVFYKQEQGNKKYAFWPLVNAKKALAQAMQEGDWAKIQAAEAEYQRRRTITDRMMEAANRTATAPIFGGNINSTRPDDDSDGLNAVPTEYLEDHAGHCRANGLFLLYAASRNMGVPVDKLLDDSANTLRDYAARFRGEKLLSSQKGKPLAARLLHAFNSELQLSAFSEWKFNLGLVSRGMNAVVGLIPKEEDRVKALGRNYCAEAAAAYEAGLENVPWENLVHAKPEQKQLVLQQALLLPEEELSLRDLGMAFSHKDWIKRLNPFDTIARLKAAHKLDYGAVIARSKALLSQAEAAPQADMANSGLSLKDFQEAVLRSYRQLLRMTPDNQRESETFKQLQAEAAQLQNGLVRNQLTEERIQLERTGIIREYQILRKKKSGWVLDEEDSKEYTSMIRAVKKLNLKLDLLEGKQLPANLKPEYLESLQKADVARLLNKAQRACFDYAKLKTKDGKSGVVLHSAGRERLRTALKLYEKLGDLSTCLGIRQPAEELKDQSKLDLLKGRSAWSWGREETEVRAARVIYAMSMQYRGVPDTQQMKRINDNLELAVERIRNQPAFRQMVRNEGAKGLADKVLSGTADLTEAYMKAAKQLEAHNAPQQQEPAPSREEKLDFWRRQEDPAAAPEIPVPQL